MNIYEMKPIYDSAKSFYKKAIVETNNNIIKLISYNSIVATINLNTNKATVKNTYSQTTLRHIKEFLRQHRYKADSKKQILEDYKW